MRNAFRIIFSQIHVFQLEINKNIFFQRKKLFS